MAAKFSSSLQQQILLSYTQLGSYAAVAKTHSVSASGVRRLVLAASNANAPPKKQGASRASAPSDCSAETPTAKKQAASRASAPSDCSAETPTAKKQAAGRAAVPSDCSAETPTAKKQAAGKAAAPSDCIATAEIKAAAPTTPSDVRSASPSVCLSSFSGQLGGGHSSPTAEAAAPCTTMLDRLREYYAAELLHACIVDLLSPERLQKARVSEITGLMRTVLEKFPIQERSGTDALRKLDVLIEGLNHAAKQ